MITIQPSHRPVRACAQTALTPHTTANRVRIPLLLFAAAFVANAHAAPVNPPTAYNEFSPTLIAVGGSSVLTITLTNDNDDAITAVGFVDNYPAPINLINDGANPVVSNTCNAAVNAPPNATFVAASNGIILPHQSCSIVIAVVGTMAGTAVNSTGPITSSNAPTGSPHSATLTITNSPLMPAPVASTNFAPSTAASGGSSTVIVHLDNVSNLPITGVHFSNTYQAGVVNATNGPVLAADTCIGTVSADAGASGFSLQSGVIPAESGCDVIVNVLATTPGIDVTSSTTAVLSAEAFPSNPTSATLTVTNDPALFEPVATVEFLPPAILIGGTSQLHIAIANFNGTTITGLGLSARLLAPLHASNAPDHVIVDNSCGGTLAANANGDSLSFVGGHIDALGSCDLRINVVGTSDGSTDVQTSAIASSNARAGDSVTATLTVDNAPLLLAPLVSTTFTPSDASPGGTSQLEIKLVNPNMSGEIDGVQVDDMYPPGLSNAAQDPIVSNTCGGTLVADPGEASLELSGGVLDVVPPGSAECTIRVNVVGTNAGAHIENHTGAVLSANAWPGNDAFATLDISTDPLLPTPSIAMEFAPSSIIVGGASAMTITLTNPNGTAVQGAQFQDWFPKGLAKNLVVSNTCGGIIDEGAGFVALLDGTIPATGSCSIVAQTGATAVGSLVNTTTVLSSSNANVAPGATAMLDVGNGGLLPAPTVTKSFEPTMISAGGQSQMVIALSNGNSSAILGAQVFDAYPAGMKNAPNDAIASNSCGGTLIADADGTSIVLSDATLAPNEACEIRINVVGTTPNTLVDNHTGQVLSANAVAASDAHAVLTVTGTPLLPAPMITKEFAPTHIVPGGTAQMTITLANPNATTVAGAVFADAYPPGMTATPNAVIANTCGGFLDQFPDEVALANVDLAANSSCKLVVSVTANAVGDFINETSVLSSANAVVAGAATATLTVDAGPLLPAPVLTKSFAPATVSVGGTSQMTIAIANADPSSAVTGVYALDPYPAHIANASGNALISNTCGGTVTAAPGDTQMVLSGGSVAAGGQCEIVVNVVGTSAGSLDNHVNATSANAPPSDEASAHLTVTGSPLLAAPTVAKGFMPSTVDVGSISQMTIALGNPNATQISGAQFVDAYPSGIANALNGIIVSNTCGGTLSAAPSGTSAALANGTIPLGGCSVVLHVVATASGPVVNHTGGVQTSNALAGADASATLTVNPASANHAPVAVDDAAEVAPGDVTSAVVGDPAMPNSVLHNDVDADAADSLTATKLTDPAHGTLLQFNPDGTFVYQNTGAAQSDTFTYRACDNHNACSPPATVSITIGSNLNDHSPFATDDAIAVAPGATTSALIGDANAIDSVLDNDVDIDPNDVLEAHLLVAPQHGTLLAFATDGTLTYRNDDPLATTDSFSYEACDLEGACALGVVSITIGQNIDDELPVVVDDALQVAPNGSTSDLVGDAHATDSVLDNDSDPDPSDMLHTNAVCNLVNGSGTLTLQSDGTFVYQNSAPVASDFCFHETCDLLGACVSSRLTVNVTAAGMDQPPVPMDDAIDVAPSGTASTLVGDANVPASVLDNDMDPDDQHSSLTAHLIAPPSSGTITLELDGTFVYENTDPSASVDEFRYEVCDPSQACVGATVSVTIDHDAPTISCRLPTQVGMVGSAVSIDLATLFTPPPGESLVYDATNLPQSLSLVGALVSGTLQPGDVAGSPFASTLRASAGGAWASEDVMFQVLPAGDILLRDGFDFEDPNQRCE